MTLTMKATKSRKTKAPKRTDRGVPFEEMRRLMNVYGSIKCLRKRGAPGGGEENTKIDSVKRKFYRWFPDLEERFEKDGEGFYRPKFGHEFEMRYREEMRKEDGEVLAKKRARCRKERHGSAEGKTKRSKTKHQAATTSSTFTSNCARVSPIVSPVVSPVVFPDGTLSAASCLKKKCDLNAGVTLKYDHDPMVSSSAAITADTEPVDSCFIAEQGIFDDVEKSFYGPSMQEFVEKSLCGPTTTEQEMQCKSAIQEYPRLYGPSMQEFVETSLCGSTTDQEMQKFPPAIQEYPSLMNTISRSSSEQTGDSDSPFIEDMLERSIEECCEEILGSDDNDSMDGYLFDMISS